MDMDMDGELQGHDLQEVEEMQNVDDIGDMEG